MSNQKKYYLSFKTEVKKAILSDATLLTELSNSDNLNTTIDALCTMFKRNSQTLMHISLLKIISRRKKIEIDNLTIKTSDLPKKQKK